MNKNSPAINGGNAMQSAVSKVGFCLHGGGKLGGLSLAFSGKIFVYLFNLVHARVSVITVHQSV